VSILFINSSINLASHWDIIFSLFEYVMNKCFLKTHTTNSYYTSNMNLGKVILFGMKQT